MRDITLLRKLTHALIIFISVGYHRLFNLITKFQCHKASRYRQLTVSYFDYFNTSRISIPTWCPINTVLYPAHTICDLVKRGTKSIHHHVPLSKHKHTQTHKQANTSCAQCYIYEDRNYLIFRDIDHLQNLPDMLEKHWKADRQRTTARFTVSNTNIAKCWEYNFARL